MFNKKKILLCAVLGFFSLTEPVYAEELPPFGYPAYETVNIHANSNNKDYELYIQLPKSYSDTKDDLSINHRQRH
jgi:uncharacterized protein